MQIDRQRAKKYWRISAQEETYYGLVKSCIKKGKRFGDSSCFVIRVIRVIKILKIYEGSCNRCSALVYILYLQER